MRSNREVIKAALGRQVGGSHYTDMGIQPWEIIERNRLDFWEGSAMSYLLRWRVAEGMKDIDKAIHYLERIKELHAQGYYDKELNQRTKDERTKNDR